MTDQHSRSFAGRQSLWILLLIAAAVVWWLEPGRFLSLNYLQEQRQHLLTLRETYPLMSMAVFIALYTLIAALSIPGAVVLTLAAGALFGWGWGTVMVSFASTWGATGAFLVSRYLLRDTLQKRYRERLRVINAGIEKDGAFYLFTLRLVPIFPFFLINVLMGLTTMRVWNFLWISQLGMLAGTAAYVGAGTQLAQLQSLSGILSPALLATFVLLGLFPLLARKVLAMVAARKVYAGYSKPRSFDRNLIVIGAGAGGLVTSFIGAAVRAKVTLIEKHKMGGDCLNYGCVPSKSLIRSAKFASHMKRASEYGFDPIAGHAHFPAVMNRVRRIIGEVAPNDSAERYTALGVEVLDGTATLLDPWTVEVRTRDGETRRLTARSIVLATGAEPAVPAIPGLAENGYLTSDTLWELTELPKRLVVLGGGPIGSELTQAFARLGARVTQVERQPRLLMREDAEVSELVANRFRADGIDIRLNTHATEVRIVDGEKRLMVTREGVQAEIPFDQILVAVGRNARLTGYGLEALGVTTAHTVEVNEFLQTNYPNIYACGDVAGPYQFTHTAAHMAWYAAVNALFAPLLWLRGGRFKVDYSVIPWATFTEPEVARVGLNENDATARNIPYELVTYPLDELDRARADGEAHGFVKVLTAPGRDRILGVTIVGEHAGDLIAEFVLAMRYKLGLKKLLGTIHIYPTLAEANKYAAGLWTQAHKPEKLLQMVEKFHALRRGAAAPDNRLRHGWPHAPRV